MFFFFSGMLPLGHARFISSSGGRHGASAILMMESAVTAQGVDVALLLCGGRAWSTCKLNPSFNNVRAICCRTGLQCVQNMQVQFASVGIVLAHVGRFWATSQNVWLYVGLCRPMSALSWPMLGRG